MNLHDLVSQLIIDTKGNAGAGLTVSADSSIAVVLPELILCATILVMLLVRVFKGGERVDTFWIALLGAGLSFYYAAPWSMLNEGENAGRMEVFTGMLVYDTFSVFVRSALLLFLVLFVVFTKLSGLPDREDGPDIYTLFFGATIGMCLMATANHLLMVFMAVEMASVPSYALAGMLKGRKKSSEAALKYAVYGAGAAGVMLYGISLIAGLLNTAHIPTMALEIARRFGEFGAGEVMVLAMGGLMLSVGLAFKLSAVPFHFWAPDVFEGATAEVNAFLSVASKAAALALLVRVAVGLGTVAPETKLPGWKTVAAATATADGEVRTGPATTGLDQNMYLVQAEVPRVAGEPVATKYLVSGAEGANLALAPIRSFIAQVIIFLAVVTCTFGNLAAYGQTNIKRLLAYSTIAHAGYMMMPVAAAVAVAGYNPAVAQDCIAALAIYVVVYLFMNLGAFAVVAFLRNAMRSEEIADYAGLIRRAPGTVICFCLILFSLIGLPPLAGFIGKFAIFARLVHAYGVTVDAGRPANYLMIALIVGGLNTAISLFYYLRVAKVMTIDDEARDRPPFAFSDVSLQGAYLWLITLPTAVLMLSWDGLNRMAERAAHYLFV
jgi:NADH-quinone oxidoreductase subunit N